MQVHPLLRGDDDPLLVVSLEAGLHNTQAVSARHQAREDEGSISFGREIADLLRKIVG